MDSSKNTENKLNVANESGNKYLDAGVQGLGNFEIKKKEEPEYKNAGPDAPGYLGLPVVVTDTKGNRIGNVWNPNDNGLGDALKSREKGESSKVYLDLKTGKFTNYPSSTMSYKNGKIQLNVADDVANSSWYKNLIDSDYFKNLSEAYALDPTGKTELEIEKKDGNKEKHSINDLLEEFAKQIQDNSQKYKGNVDTRELFRKATNGALILSDEAMTIMSNYQDIKKESYKPDAMVPLPDYEKDYFKSYESYKEENGQASISAEDFYKHFYHLDEELPESAKAILEDLGNGLLGEGSKGLRNTGESEKDYAIDLIRLNTEKEMNNIVSRLMLADMEAKNDPVIQEMRKTRSLMGVASEEEKERLTTEFVKSFSLLQMMNQDTPDSNSWTGFNLAVQNLALGAGDKFIEQTEGALVGGSIMSYVLVGTGAGVAGSIDGVFRFLRNILVDFFTGGPDKVNENFVDLPTVVQQTIDEYTGEGTMTDEIKQSIQNVTESIRERSDLRSELFPDELYEEMAQTYANAATMQRIGAIAGYALNQVLITNPIGSAVGEAVAGVTAAALSAKALTTLSNMSMVFGSIGITANRAWTVTKALSILNKIDKISSIAGFAANIYTQGIVDTFLENPTLYDAIIFGESEKNTVDFQEALRGNIIANAIGEIIPFAGKNIRGAGKKFITSTKPGAIMQGIARKTINRITLRGRKIYQGIAEFMTKKSKDVLVEDLGVDAPWAKIANPEKRMQALRKEIMEVQEQIRDTKIFRGEGSWSENAKNIDELIQKRIDLEETLGTAKKIQLAEAKNRIIKNADLKVEIENLSISTASLSKLSRKMGQTSMPGSFSPETSDYINDLFNKRLLENKESFLSKTGKTLSKNEQAAYDALTDRIAKYEASLPAAHSAEYKQLVQDYMTENGRYYYKLNNFLASDAGGNLIPLDQLEKMRANGIYGELGEQYMPMYATNTITGETGIGKMLYEPEAIIEQGKVGANVDRFNRKTFSEETVYFDPNYTRDIYTNAYAKVTNAANMTDAIQRAGRTTSIPTDSNGNILKTPEQITKAKNDLNKSLNDYFEKSFKEAGKVTELGEETLNSLQKKPESYWKNVQKQGERDVKTILGLDQRGLKRYASTMSSEDIAGVRGVFSTPDYSGEVKNIKDLKNIYNNLSDAQKKIVNKQIPGFGDTEIMGGAKVAGDDLADKSLISQDLVDHWNYAVLNDNMDTALYRQYIKDSPTILESQYYKDMVTAKRTSELVEEEALALREANLKIGEAQGGLKVGDTPADIKAFNKIASERFDKVVSNTIDDAVSATAEALRDNPYLEQLIKEYEKMGISSDSAKEYLIYQWLNDHSNDGGVLQKIALNYYNAPSKVSGLKVSTDAANKLSKKFTKASQSIIESKLNKLVAKLNEEGVEGLIDLEATMKRVDSYFKDISDLWGAKRIVEAWDRSKGQFIYYKVDNSTYNLVTNYPTFKKNNLVARSLARMNSIARIGQITLRTASLVTQGFKDTLNAIILGGWDELMLDNPATYKKIAMYMGDNVVEAFKKEMTPSAWENFLKTADAEGLTVKEAIAKSEVGNELLNIKIEGPGTSTQYYSARNLRQGMDATEQTVKDTWLKNKSRWMQYQEIAGNALGWINERANFLHNVRESLLRKQVYRQNFMEALSMGKSLQQARNYASYFMENATTNFSRGFAWGSNIVRSIPYFGAMLNGASSMIRLLEVDPVGIMMRFTTDLILPTVGLTVMSLQNETDAEIYKNIPEYEKNENMHWVMNGEVFTIPLPEELAKFILPIRHAVEKMHDANDIAWHELVMNDLLNMPTVALNDVMMLDAEKLGADISVTDRISALGMSLFNAMSPNAGRTAYITMTGKDPYTGKNYGKMKWFVDENGEYQLMAVSEFEFCNDLADLFKGWGWEISPLMAEGTLSSIFGAGSMDIAEGIRDFAAAAQKGEFNLPALISPSLERAGNVLTGTTRTNEQQAMVAWYNVINELKDKKNTILAPNGKLNKYAQDIDMAKTQEKYQQAVDFYNAEVNNWQNEVIKAVKQYNENFGDFFDRSKFAATLSVMTTELSIDSRRDSTDYNDAKALAVQTMYDAGFRSPNDNSIFGYVSRNYETGGYEIKYYDPLVVSMTKNLLWYQSDDALQMIDNTIVFSGLKTKYNEVIYPAYSKFMDAGDYNSANKLAADWDVEVIEAIKPILDEYSAAGTLLNNSKVIDYLDNYILIPNTTEAIGKGKYYSSKTGLNKRRGFAQSYAKKIYEAMKKENK